MDAIDIAFIDSMIPKGMVSTGFLAICTWLDEDGLEHYRIYNQLEARISGVLGLLELTKVEMMRDCMRDDG